MEGLAGLGIRLMMRFYEVYFRKNQEFTMVPTGKLKVIFEKQFKIVKYCL
jgi:hypothetical protein